MALWSGLKKAYDTLETEISNTLDSSRGSQSGTRETVDEEGEARPVSEPAFDAEAKAPPQSLDKPPAAAVEDHWGAWEAQTTSTVTPTRQQRAAGLAVPPHTGSSLTPSPPPHERDMSQTTSEEVSPVASSTPNKLAAGKTPVDAMSREELMKHIKKQTALLQKMKIRTDQLTKECSKLKNDLSSKSETNNETLVTELQVLKTERDKAVTQLRDLQQSFTEQKLNAQREVSELSQRLVSMEADHKTALADQQMERVKLEEKCKTLSLETSRLQDEMSSHEQDLATHRTSLAELRHEKASLLSECESLRHRVAQWEEEEKARTVGAETNEKTAAARVEMLVKEKQELSAEVERLHSELKEQEQTAVAECGTQRERVSQLEEQLEKMARDKKRELESLSNKLEEADEAMKHELETSEEKRNSAEQQLMATQATIRTTEERAAYLLEENRALQVKVTESEERVCAVKKEQAALQHKVQKADTCVEEEKRARETAMEEKDCEAKRLSEQLIEEERKVAALRQELAELSGDREQLNETVRNDLTTATEKLEDMAKENSSLKATIAEQSSRHKEETKKLKALIIRLKKEMADLREKLKEASTNQTDSQVTELKEQLLRANQLLETQTSKSTDLNEETQKLKEQLEAGLKREAAVKEECQQLRSTLQDLEEKMSVLTSELSAAQADITTARAEASTSKLTAESCMSELATARETLDREQTTLRETLQKLETSEKEAKASSVMDLELADYRRSAEVLKRQVEEKEARQREQEQLTATHLQQLELAKKEIESVRQQSSQHEETTTKLKALLRKTKVELAELKNQLGEAQKVSDDLKEQLEAERLHNEGSKVDIAQLTATVQTLEHQTTSDTTRHHQLVHSLEQQLSSLQGTLAKKETTISQLQQEYDSYKVRVHSVLKQKSTAPSATEVETSLRKEFELEIMKLKAELKNTQDQLSSILTDHNELMSDHEQLSLQHDQTLRETEQERTQLLDKLCISESKQQMTSRELEEQKTIQQHEITRITTAFKVQIHGLQQQHQQTVEGLRKELVAAHADLSRLQQEADAHMLRNSRPPPPPPQRVRSIQVEEEHEERVVPPSTLPLPREERSSGEGMDHNELEAQDTASVTPSTLNHTASFERLLSTSSPHSSMKPSQEERQQQEVDKQQKQLQSAMQKVTHLAELLHESEANCVRLGDQAKLLKEEIRRLERNQERHESVSNMEYLKNVILKFLHSTSSEERQPLVPIMTRLLQLSQQERNFLQETIKGNKSDLPDASGVTKGEGVTKGWGSYVQRWTGY